MKHYSVILLALLLSACVPSGLRVPQSPFLSLLERKSGRIAYIALDGNIYLTDQAASKTTQLTKDADLGSQGATAQRAYHNPTWSRDGGLLAFIGVQQNGSDVESKIIVANVDKPSVKEVYSSKSEHPFYLYWSPDSKTVSFLSSTATAQSMSLQSVSVDSGKSQVLDTGTPFYWSWAPDAETMIVHKGGVDPTSAGQLAFLRVQSDVSEFGMDLMPAAFQAPAWSPNGQHILLTDRSADGKNEIVLTDSTGTAPKKIDSFDAGAAFAWSADSSRFAYINGQAPLNAGTIGDLHVYDLGTSTSSADGENVVGFFWSPNGEKLAYFVLFVADATSTSDSAAPAPSFLLELHLLDIASGKSDTLFKFAPTDQFASILPYFDQYHQSMTIWSPDSANIVLPFVGNDGKPGLVIIGASGRLEPRLLADGVFAVWSWE